MNVGAVMVTGGAGFLGRWVARVLAERGEVPVLFDIVAPFPRLDFKHEFWQGDLLDAQDAEACIVANNVGRIIHTTFISEPLMSVEDPGLPDHVRLNLDGTLNLLEAARRNGSGFVFVSSKSVYGPLQQDADQVEGVPVLREDYRKAPNDLYGSTKLVCEQLLSAYRQTWNVDYGIVRFATLWGPGKSERYTRLAPHSRMIEAAHNGMHYRLQAGGDQLDDMIYVKDAAAGVATLALSPALSGQDFNLGTGRLQRFGDLAAFLLEEFPNWRAEIGAHGSYLGLGEDQMAHCLVDTTKAKRLLGFETKYDLRSGAADYLQWLRRETLPDAV